ncbi:MAG: response regulator [Oceanicaulis sp.]|nr:response regulator [Oceanicaulis sp.]
MIANGATPDGLDKLRIAVVDDNAAMRGIVRSVLGAFGITQVYEAADVEAALQILRAEKIDVLICDWKMKPVDGLSLVRTLRDPEESPCPLLPIIMLTAYAEPSKVKEARDAGVTEFLVKPFAAEGLYGRLQMIVNRPRPFVRTKVFFGPDRRRLASGYQGPERRDDAAPLS